MSEVDKSGRRNWWASSRHWWESSLRPPQLSSQTKPISLVLEVECRWWRSPLGICRYSTVRCMLCEGPSTVKRCAGIFIYSVNWNWMVLNLTERLSRNKQNETLVTFTMINYSQSFHYCLHGSGHSSGFQVIRKVTVDVFLRQHPTNKSSGAREQSNGTTHK